VLTPGFLSFIFLLFNFVLLVLRHIDYNDLVDICDGPEALT